MGHRAGASIFQNAFSGRAFRRARSLIIRGFISGHALQSGAALPVPTLKMPRLSRISLQAVAGISMPSEAFYTAMGR